MTNLEHILSLIRIGIQLRSTEDGSLTPPTKALPQDKACQAEGCSAATCDLEPAGDRGQAFGKTGTSIQSIGGCFVRCAKREPPQRGLRASFEFETGHV